MARVVFRLPDVGEGIAEAELVAWHVQAGADIAEDDPLVEVMTDKATVEIPSPYSGRVVSIAGTPGDRLAIGSDLVVFEVQAEDETEAAEDGASAGVGPKARAGSVPPAGVADATAPARDGSPVAASADAGSGVAAPDVADAGTAAPHAAGMSVAAARVAAEPSASPPAGPACPDAAPGAPPPSTTPALTAGRTAAPRSAARDVSAAPAAANPASDPLIARPAAKPLAAPAVRERAQRLGLDLTRIAGSGPDGRVTHADLDQRIAGATPAAQDGVTDIRVIGLRRRIAERMQDAVRRIPHFTYAEELDVGALEDLRAALNADHAGTQPRLTLLPFLIRALVRAVPRFPQVNALYDDEAGVVRRHAAVHVGIATQTAQGLMVPVLRHAEALDPWQCAAGVARLAEAARRGEAERAVLTGSTITVTSLGRLGGIVSTPIINAPEVAIIGVNRIIERPVMRGGVIGVGRLMNLSCSFDHRVVDGWDAAAFVQELKALLEQPARLFMAPPAQEPRPSDTA